MVALTLSGSSTIVEIWFSMLIRAFKSTHRSATGFRDTKVKQITTENRYKYKELRLTEQIFNLH